MCIHQKIFTKTIQIYSFKIEISVTIESVFVKSHYTIRSNHIIFLKYFLNNKIPITSVTTNTSTVCLLALNKTLHHPPSPSLYQSSSLLYPSPSPLPKPKTLSSLFPLDTSPSQNPLSIHVFIYPGADRRNSPTYSPPTKEITSLSRSRGYGTSAPQQSDRYLRAGHCPGRIKIRAYK